MALMRASKLAMSTPWMCMSSGTGRTPGGKLKMALAGAPIHSPMSRAFARETHSPTTRAGRSSCEPT